jgi:hypothetical protein
MRRHRRLAGPAVLVICLLMTAGCAHIASVDAEQMYGLASALTKLSAAVESAVGFKDPPAGITDAGLVEFATQHDPTLRTPFEGYTLRTLRRDPHAAVLVCTPDGKRALLEDAGCSAALDKHRWKDDPPTPCEFTLDLAAVCAPR